MILLFRILASLNLPAAIEDLSGAKCPQSVLDKAAELKNMGGLQSIDQMMENLPDLLSRNRDVLDEVLLKCMMLCGICYYLYNF